MIKRIPSILSACLTLDVTCGSAALAEFPKWGFIGKSGKVVIQPEFDSAWSFSSTIAERKSNKLI
jgi:hypothetical protein